MKTQTPSGLNHIVLAVRDLDESHWFWTECLGFRHVGTSRRDGAESRPRMRFYSGMQDGRLHHHDVALVERPDMTVGTAHSLQHLAITYPDADAWDQQVAFLARKGVALFRRVDHGVTRSVSVRDPNGYEVELVDELPRAAWEADIDAALNCAVAQPVG